MSVTSRPTAPRMRYHPNAYDFIFAALQYTQERLGRRSPTTGPEEEADHISGTELLEGVRDLARQRFGLMALAVFQQWGIATTEDFGRIVFELVEQGKMRKTERDQLSDFSGVYEFADAFDRNYQIDTSRAFRQ